MVKKILRKTQSCIAEKRWPQFELIRRSLHASRMILETFFFNLQKLEWDREDLARPKKYLYASPVGAAGKALLAKVISKFGHKDFDYLIFVWDDTRFDEDMFKECKIIYEKGLKWFFMKKYLTPDFSSKYAYLFLWDDDLDVEGFNYQNFIAVMAHNKLQVAQPALSGDSYTCHPITLRQTDKVGRYVDFVEIMAQVFRADAWSAFWQMMRVDGNFWGWGYDSLARAVCGYKNMAIIDSQCVKHIRPSRENELAKREGNLFTRQFSKKLLAKQVSYGKLKSPPGAKYNTFF